MNISPDDFKKIGIDSSAIQSKKEQTTYKIKYVTRYVRQWAIIEAGRKTISQINFIDCMCIVVQEWKLLISLMNWLKIHVTHRKSLWFF